MIVIDELSSFKNAKAKRFRSLMRVRPKVKRIVGLTGTPAPGGLMDLWAEMKLLDMGQRLGRFIGRYREAFFKPAGMNPYTGVVYNYTPLPGAEEKIYERMAASGRRHAGSFWRHIRCVWSVREMVGT